MCYVCVCLFVFSFPEPTSLISERDSATRTNGEGTVKAAAMVIAESIVSEIYRVRRDKILATKTKQRQINIILQ